MAVVLVEGFDTYNGITSTSTNIGIDSGWNVLSTTGLSLTTGRFGGQAVSTTNYDPGGVTRSWTTGISSFTVGFALYVSVLPGTPTSVGDSFITLRSGSTYMIGLQLASTGSLNVRRMTGLTTGTILGSTNSGVIAGGSWNYIELSVTISDAAGTVDLQVNGQNVLSLTNQDTRNGTPTTVDTIQIGGLNALTTYGGLPIIDDLYITDNTTPLGEQRVETLYPTADTAQEQWTRGESFAIGTGTTASTTAYATKGNIYTCNGNVTVKSVTSYFGAVAQNVKLGIARLNSVNPGTVAEVLYESSVVNLGSTAMNSTFNVPDIAFTSGNVYGIYFTRTDGTGTSVLSVASTATSAPIISDQAGTLLWSAASRITDNNIGVGDSLFFETGTYVTMTLGLTSFTADNYSLIDATLMTPGGFTSSNTVGNFDLYDFGNLSTTPTSISAVTVNAAAEKDNVGTRAVATTVKSGSSTTDGSNVYLASGWNVSSRILDTDPNTSSAWTASGVNNLQAGVKVTI